MSKDKNVFVIPVGTKVKLHDDIFGTVTKIVISYDNSVFYEVCWWNGRSKTIETFHSTEVENVDDVRTKIGFI